MFESTDLYSYTVVAFIFYIDYDTIRLRGGIIFEKSKIFENNLQNTLYCNIYTLKYFFWTPVYSRESYAITFFVQTDLNFLERPQNVDIDPLFS